jgi:hypothetical protein
MKNLNIVLLASLCLSVSACRYSAEFKGKLNGKDATVTAFSRNIDKRCVALSFDSSTGLETQYIDACSAFNPTNPAATKNFNTKNADCNLNQTQYLEGTRSTVIVATSSIKGVEQVDAFFCQTVFYKEYTYQDKVTFDVKSKSNDEVLANFSGLSKKATYIDYDNATLVGDRWMCDYLNPNQDQF